jgi:hypothetical protein
VSWFLIWFRKSPSKGSPKDASSNE